VNATDPLSSSRRRWLHALAGAAAAPYLAGLTGLASTAHAAHAHAPFGLIDPLRPAPALMLRWHDGHRSPLPTALKDRVTIVQTMFTGCSATCPIQGALFDELQQRIHKLPSTDPVNARIRLLSLSIDPLSDDPAALRGWLARFHAGDRWAAAATTPEQVDVLLDFLAGRASGADRHTTQFAIFDTQGRFAYRTREMPPPDAVLPIAQSIGRGEHLKPTIGNAR